MTATAFNKALVALRDARHVAALTGAGISKESGLPTFREAQTGLWSRYRPEDLATPEAFARDPLLVWRWYQWRRGLVNAAEPNPAHRALVTLARTTQLALITQNVDGLHARAGSTDVIELHGNITRDRCNRCHCRAAADASVDTPPGCGCGGTMRPDVVWFGEMLPADALERATQAAAMCDVFIAIGTSGIVYPAAGLSAVAQRAGATVVSINPDIDAAPPGAIQLTASAATMLPALLEALPLA